MIRALLRWALGILALVVVQSEVVEGRRSQFVIEHAGNEGSHAFVNYLTYCLNVSVSATEYFEGSNAQFLKPGHTNSQLLQHWLAGDEGGLSDFLKNGIINPVPVEVLDDVPKHGRPVGEGTSLPVHFRAKPRFAWEVPDAENSEPRILRDFNRLVTKRTGPIGALVRLAAVTPTYNATTITKRNLDPASARAAVFCDTFNDVDEVLIMLRTDLMRWSLSEYDTVHLRGKRAHLQFEPDAEDRRVEMHHVDIEALANIAHKQVQIYGQKARYAKELNKCGKKVTFVQYEYFLDSSPTCSQLEAPTSTERVHRVHSNRLADFVENPDEVFALFAGGIFPSFSKVYAKICCDQKGGRTDIFKTMNFYKLGDIPVDYF